MTEYFIEALVLSRQENGDLDGSVILYTKDLGKIIAKAKSIKKITSKLNSHLQPLNFVSARLVEKKGLQVVDALTIDSQKSIRQIAPISAKFLRILNFIGEMTFEFQPDFRLWLAIKEIIARPEVDESAAYRFLLKIFGFDPESANCALCSRKTVKVFLKDDHIFLCGQCGEKIWKDRQDEVVLL